MSEHRCIYNYKNVILILSLFLIISSSIGCNKQPEDESANHLRNAKELLAKQDITNEDWRLIEFHLIKVGDKSTSYKESQQLLPKVQAKVSEINAKKTKLTLNTKEKRKQIDEAGRNLMLLRKEFAKKYEQEMLEKGLDVYASTLGKNHSTFKIKYILISRPLVYQLANDEGFTGRLRMLGFKKLIMSDGYNHTWSIKLD